MFLFHFFNVMTGKFEFICAAYIYLYLIALLEDYFNEKDNIICPIYKNKFEMS